MFVAKRSFVLTLGLAREEMRESDFKREIGRRDKVVSTFSLRHIGQQVLGRQMPW